MNPSQRTPGYKFRPIPSSDLEKQRQESLNQLAVHGDGAMGIPVRTATPEDGERAEAQHKPSKRLRN